jgi:histidinol dehydrogenase
MRILDLTNRVAERLLAGRSSAHRAAERVARRIVRDVRRRGDAALLDWSRRLGDADFASPGQIWVPAGAFGAARRAADPALLRAIERAARNIRRVAERQNPRSWSLEVEPGVRVGQLVRPLGTVGCYVPGGRFTLVSTLLMTAIPAQVAGVRRIVVACPKPNAALLAAANLLGISEVARVGGAQAIAALAYGTQTVPQVDKICGPGNRFVTAAKRVVSNDCAIDMLAGPTELLVLAVRGNARFIAADLLAQAEHEPDAIALLVTPSRRLARAVALEVRRQAKRLRPGNPSRVSLQRRGAILLTRTPEQAVRFANRYAPEHLSLPGADREWLKRIEAAGSVFLGPWSAQPLGDYATGSNHTLPTGARARARGGLSAADFVKCISIQRVSRRGFLRLAEAAGALADAESLTAHRRALEVRK